MPKNTQNLKTLGQKTQNHDSNIFIIVEMTIDNLYFNPNLSVNELTFVSKLHNKQVFPLKKINSCSVQSFNRYIAKHPQTKKVQISKMSEPTTLKIFFKKCVGMAFLGPDDVFIPLQSSST